MSALCHEQQQHKWVMRAHLFGFFLSLTRSPTSAPCWGHCMTGNLYTPENSTGWHSFLFLHGVGGMRPGPPPICAVLLCTCILVRALNSTLGHLHFTASQDSRCSHGCLDLQQTHSQVQCVHIKICPPPPPRVPSLFLFFYPSLVNTNQKREERVLQIKLLLQGKCMC